MVFRKLNLRPQLFLIYWFYDRTRNKLRAKFFRNDSNKSIQFFRFIENIKHNEKEEKERESN